MIAILLSLVAALGWSSHDLRARRFGGPIGPFRMAFWVMLAGAFLLLIPVLWRGTVWTSPPSAVALAMAMGVVYAIAAAGLFYALTLAPVSIVGPIVGGYPALVVIWGLVNGLQPTFVQWMCIGVILVGVVVVARSEHEGEGFSDVVSGKLPLVQRVMVDAPIPAVKLTVPLQVDARAALNWDEAH